MSLDPGDEALNHDVASWCDAATVMANGDHGTPGAGNDACGGGGPQVVYPDDIVFTEVMQNPAAVADEDGEYFEMLNLTANPIDLSGCVFSDAGSDSFTVSGSLVVGAGDRVVLGRNADLATNGGISVQYEFGGMSLGNTDDELILTCGLTEVDNIAWDDGVDWPDPTGSSMNLDEAFTLQNGVGANWCASSTTMVNGDNGTPGVVNDAC